MDWELVKARRRGYAKAHGVGAILAMVVLTIWAVATGPKVVHASSLVDLYAQYADSRSSLALTAIALWLGSLVVGIAAWHLMIERPRFRGVTDQTWFGADRLFVFVSMLVTLLMPTLGAGVTITTVPDEVTMTFVTNPAGAAQLVIAVAAVLAYFYAGSLALAADWAEGRAEAKGTAPA